MPAIDPNNLPSHEWFVRAVRDCSINPNAYERSMLRRLESMARAQEAVKRDRFVRKLVPGSWRVAKQYSMAQGRAVLVITAPESELS